MRPSIPTRNLARRLSVRLEPADLAAGDEDAVGAGEGFGDAERKEPAVERELARSEVGSLELGGGRGEQVGLVGRSDLGGHGDDQAARAAAGVLADLCQLNDVAELGRLAQLALADRPCVGIGHRHQPVGDLLPGQPLADLPGDLCRAVGELVDPACSSELGLRAAAAGALAQVGSDTTCLSDRALNELAGLAGQPQRRRFAPGPSLPPACGLAAAVGAPPRASGPARAARRGR